MAVVSCVSKGFVICFMAPMGRSCHVRMRCRSHSSIFWLTLFFPSILDFLKCLMSDRRCWMLSIKEIVCLMDSSLVALLPDWQPKPFHPDIPVALGNQATSATLQ